MSLVQSIRAGFADAVRARCRERGCELRLRGLKSRVVLRGEVLCRDRKMPDCVIFVEAARPVIAIAELKSQTIHADEIREKLVNGSKRALEIFQARSATRCTPNLYHLLLCKSCPPSERKTLRDRRLRVAGVKYDIIVRRCGASLSQVISAL